MEQEDFWKVVQANTVRPCTNIIYRNGSMWRSYKANSRELYAGVKWSKRTTPISVIYKYNHNNHRYKLHTKIYREFMDRVINDVINNDAQYHMILGCRHFTIQTEVCDPEYVSIIRKKGMSKEWDPFESNGIYLIVTLSDIRRINRKKLLSLSNKNRIALINKSHSIKI